MASSRLVFCSDDQRTPEEWVPHGGRGLNYRLGEAERGAVVGPTSSPPAHRASTVQTGRPPHLPTGDTRSPPLVARVLAPCPPASRWVGLHYSQEKSRKKVLRERERRTPAAGSLRQRPPPPSRAPIGRWSLAPPPRPVEVSSSNSDPTRFAMGYLDLRRLTVSSKGSSFSVGSASRLCGWVGRAERNG